MYKLDQIKKAVQSKGYKWFTGKNYDVNIVGVRNSETGAEVTNRFDDCITVSYLNEKGQEIYFEFPATTDPGKHWVENIMRESGVAILKEGQYRGSHKIGLHQGKYEALRQKAPVKVYRDNDRDQEFDLIEENVEKGIYGINIHKAGKNSTQIDRWSAGCQVIASSADFELFMDIMYEAKKYWGNSFTYTLINSNDIK